MIQREAEINSYDGRTISGRAVTFNRQYRVSDGGPAYVEEYAPEAFKRTLSHRSEFPLLIGHDRRSLPVGVVQFETTDEGLDFHAQIARTAEGDGIVELVNMRAVTAVSIGATPIAPRSITNNFIRRTEVALRELSLVTFGALDDAQILTVRESIDTMDLDDYRRRLRLHTYNV